MHPILAFLPLIRASWTRYFLYKFKFLHNWGLNELCKHLMGKFFKTYQFLSFCEFLLLCLKNKKFQERNFAYEKQDAIQVRSGTIFGYYIWVRRFTFHWREFLKTWCWAATNCNNPSIILKCSANKRSPLI